MMLYNFTFKQNFVKSTLNRQDSYTFYSKKIFREKYPWMASTKNCKPGWSRKSFSHLILPCSFTRIQNSSLDYTSLIILLLKSATSRIGGSRQHIRVTACIITIIRLSFLQTSAATKWLLVITISISPLSQINSI